MHNDIIEIRDRFLINDTHSKIRGFVAAYNEKGDRLFLEENMIVESGREAILNSLITGGALFNNITAFISPSTNATRPEMVYDGSGEQKKIKVSETSTIAYNCKLVASSNLHTLTYGDADHKVPDVRTICFKIDIPKNFQGAGTRWGSLGLLTGAAPEEGESDTRKLFSRVTFPPYPQSADLTFYYYIYF